MSVEPKGEAAVEKSDLVSVFIDGTEVKVPKGTMAIRAAELIGVAIPRFCDHPLLDPMGACRQCLVEVPDAGNGRGFPKPQASCTLEVAPGMKISTQVTSDALRDVDGSLVALSAARTTAGDVLNHIDDMTSRLSSQKLDAQTQRSNAEDLDMIQALSDFQNKQTGYDAALKSYSAIQKLSLFQYVNG